MALMPQPLSWGERMELAQRLRREAAEKITEAERIEKGLEDDQNKVWETVQKMKRDSGPNALGEGRERGILREASSGEAATSTDGLGDDDAK